MSGLGTIVNMLTIVGGSLLGLLLRQGLPERWQTTIMHGIGLCVMLIGVQMALKTNNLMIVIVSMVLGAIVGELIDIDHKLVIFGDNLGQKFGTKGAGSRNSFGEGFVTASLVYCVGAMAIVGSFQDGLLGDHGTLFAKSILDGITAIIFTVNFGVGVMVSALSVGLYQGILTLLASTLAPLMSEAMIQEMTATGGLLILAIGMNMMKITQVKIANLLPAMFVAVMVAKFF